MKKYFAIVTFMIIVIAFSVVTANNTEIPVGITLDGIPMNLEVAPL